MNKPDMVDKRDAGRDRAKEEDDRSICALRMMPAFLAVQNPYGQRKKNEEKRQCETEMQGEKHIEALDTARKPDNQFNEHDEAPHAVKGKDHRFAMCRNRPVVFTSFLLRIPAGEHASDERDGRNGKPGVQDQMLYRHR
ncbi:MAG TPA: hypothetical protein VNG29_02300 [Candidatus Paceibacterota bacterium]|nr:hypothetical protein [Candidatus Paceibacterota bacterium]